jgi:hypothetical protein
MKCTLPERPRNPRRYMWPNSERYYKAFSIFMFCAIILFIAVMIAMAIELG